MFNFGSLIFGPLMLPFISKFVFNFGVFKSAFIFPGCILLFILKSSLLEPFKSPSIGAIYNFGLLFVSGISRFILLPYNLLEPLIFKPSISAFPGMIPVRLNPNSGFGIFGTSPLTSIFGPFISISFVLSNFTPIFGLLISTFVSIFVSGMLLSICKLISGFFISFPLISTSGIFRFGPFISAWLSKLGKPILAFKSCPAKFKSAPGIFPFKFKSSSFFKTISGPFIFMPPILLLISFVLIFIFGLGIFIFWEFISILAALPEKLGPFKSDFMLIPAFPKS